MNPLAALDLQSLLQTCLLLMIQSGIFWFLLRRNQRATRSAIQEVAAVSSSLAAETEERFKNLEQGTRESLQSLEKTLKRTSQSGVAGRATTSGGPVLDRRHYVFSLAQQGLSARDISKRLNMYEGEAELMLGLTNSFQDSRAERTPHAAR